MKNEISKEEINNIVIEIIVNQLGKNKEQINNETNPTVDLNMDSLDTIEIIMEIEDRFNINIKDEDIDRLTNISSIVDYLDKKVNKNE